MSRENPRTPQRLKYLEKWYADHPDYNRDYYLKNRDRLLEQQREYVEKNKEKYRLYHRNRRLQRRAFIDRYKRLCGCVRCGYKSSAVALDLHHVNPNEKAHRISRMVSFNMERLKSEMRKCVVVCSNCHRELHENLWDLEDVL